MPDEIEETGRTGTEIAATRDALDVLGSNLAQAALTIQQALVASTAARPPAPLGGDPMHVGEPLQEVVQQFAASPDRLLTAQADLFTSYLELWRAAAKGDPLAPVTNDKRFKDPEWTENPMFEMMKASYLITTDWMNGLVERVDGIDPLTRRRIAFTTRLMTDAFAPGNFLFSNPAALREAATTRGESLVRGARAFARDLARGDGELAIQQTALDEFTVGANVATSPGKVVFQNELFQLLQFTPATKQVYSVPLLIFPPWINKYYILDLQPHKSMVRWLTEQGLTVFVVSWVNPDRTHAARALKDYIVEGVYAAIEQVLKQCSATRVNAVGYCSGGTLLSCALGHMVACGVEPVASATFFAAQQDFSDPGDLAMFVNEAWLADVEARITAAGGVLPSKAMADTFNMLRANDLIWSFYVDNYLLGKENTAFDLLFWNADQTRMAGALHMQYLRDFYLENRLSAGDYEIGGVPIDLSRVTIPVYVQASEGDHISPMGSVYRGARLFGGPTQFTLAGSGHIAGVINHPATAKYQHWTNPDLPATVEAWRAQATEHAGSWWPHWCDWLTARSGDLVAARDPSAGPLPVLEDAPGSFVKQRSSVAKPA